MSESLRNDGRIWVPKKPGDARPARDIPDSERDYYLETRYPSFGNLVPRDVASRNAKSVVDEGRGVGPLKNGVYLDFADAVKRLGRSAVEAKYGNLFEMYESITGENPYEVPMRIYPAPHYTMGGLWVDYNLMSNVDGLFVIGEANFSDHGANRLGASALMQGLADGYFVLPYTLASYLAGHLGEKVSADTDAFRGTEEEVNARVRGFLDANGSRTVDSFHRELGKIVWDECGMSRNEAGLKTALSRIPELRERFGSDLKLVGESDGMHVSLEKAGRLADFFELSELMCIDALDRKESCGGHFREEHQTPEGEAKRDDERFTHVSAWEYTGDLAKPKLHMEPLEFDAVQLTQRSYK
jgi:succinate dehydrogenase / fumarate reductase flavoprotein subunit